MGGKDIKKYAKPFGKKEKVLNYTSNTYQLTRPSKVGTVMALIRECQPASLDEWESTKGDGVEFRRFFCLW